jgi:hypothetical protein
MYGIDGSDEVVENKDLPRAEAGSPELLVIANDWRVVIEYAVRGLEVGQMGPEGRIVLPEDLPEEYDPVAFVEFERPRAHLLGPPSDEAIAGHPLAARGLRPYGIYEIKQSSWIRSLETMNRVHPKHSSEAFSRLRHFIFTFPDSTFECVAEGVRGRVLNRRHSEFLASLSGFLGEREATG